MYAVIYTKTDFDCNESVVGTPEVKVYYCKKKRLATKYIERRHNTIVKTMMKKSQNSDMIRSISHEHDANYNWAHIIYVDNESPKTTLYDHTLEEFKVVRAQEIIETLNGPALKVE